MPQTFQVLRCYKCSVFQVHQTSKSKKWECKLCGDKQSIKRFYGLGSAKACRHHVQKLNAMRGELDSAKVCTDQESDHSKNDDIIITEPMNTLYKPVKHSKWSNYVEETETVEEKTNENECFQGAEVVLEIPKKRKKQDFKKLQLNPKVLPVDHGTNPKNHPSPVVVPNTIVSLETTQSKKPQTTNPDICQPEENINMTRHKNFVPPVCHKNSKWATFLANPVTDTSAPSENLDSLSSKRIKRSPNNRLFSWGDDKDLDNILNI